VPPENLSTLLRKQPSILHLSVQKGLMPKISYLQNELNISAGEIPNLIERNPAARPCTISLFQLSSLS